MDRSKQAQLASTAAKMRARAQAEKDAAYIREGELGWKRRRNNVERRNRERIRAEQLALERRLEDQRLTRAAEAVFDAKHAKRIADATDSPDREKTLMGNAVEEGLKARRNAQQLSKQNLIKAADEYMRLKIRPRAGHDPAAINESVYRATTDELMAAGWGDYERYRIPADWKTRRPKGKFVPNTSVKLPPRPSSHLN